jgi:alpha-methylacyl-CoA racemase
VGDFGGGGLMLAYGMVCAMLEAKTSGVGQVVDAAMIDGAATLMASTFAAAQVGFWREERGTNFLDSGAHFYEVYETADGKYISLGSIEPQFYAALMEKLGDEAEHFQNQWDMDGWPAMKEKMADIIRRKTRDEWDAVFEHVGVCYAPVLSISEVSKHPHHQARGTFVEHGDYWEPAPTPRFSRTPGELRGCAVPVGQNTREILQEFGFSVEEIAAGLASGTIRTSTG